MRQGVVVSFFLIFGSVFSVWGGGSAQEETPSSEVPAAQEQVEKPLRVGDPLPDVSLVASAGEKVRLNDYAGNVILFRSFEEWCPDCNTEMPHFEKDFWKPYRDRGLVVVGIQRGSTAKEAKAFQERHGITFPIVLDPDGMFLRRFGRGNPIQVLVDMEGNISYVRTGFDPQGFYRRILTTKVEALLKSVKSVETSGASKTETGKPLRTGDRFPEGKLPRLEGGAMDFSEFRGRPVLLNFFSMKCVPCHWEAPDLENQIWRKYKSKGLVVIGVYTPLAKDKNGEKGPVEKAKVFRDRHNLTYPIVVDGDGSFRKRFAPQGVPLNVLIDEEGEIVHLKTGYDTTGMTLATLQEKLEKLTDKE